MLEKYTVEYSVRQDCFHIATMKETLRTNLRTSLEGIDNDYRVIYICDTLEEANRLANDYRNLIEKKKAERQ